MPGPTRSTPQGELRGTPEVEAVVAQAISAARAGADADAARLYEEAAAKARLLGDSVGEARALEGRGDLHGRFDRFQEALDLYDRAARLYERAGDSATLARMLATAGVSADRARQWPRSLAYLQRSLAMARRIGDRVREAYTLASMGGSYRGLAQWHKAIAVYEEALPLFRRLGERRGEADTLYGLADVHAVLDMHREALDERRQGLLLMRQTGRRGEEAALLRKLGESFQDLGEWRQARACHEQAVGLYHALGDDQGEVAALSGLANVWAMLGEAGKADTCYRGAMDCLTRALEQARRSGDRRAEARRLRLIGDTYGALGQWSETLRVDQQSLEIYRQLGDRDSEAFLLGGLGTAYTLLGRWDAAREHQEHALALFRELGDQRSQADMLAALGSSYRSLGMWARARELQEEALILYRRFGGVDREQGLLGAIAWQCFYGSGEIGRALEYHDRRVELMRRAEDRAGEADALDTMGSLYSSIAQPDVALAYHRRAQALFQRIGSRRYVDTLCSMGVAHARAGRDREAMACYRSVIALSEKHADRAGTASALCRMGELQLRRGALAGAQSLFRRSLAICRDAGDRTTEASAHQGLGDAWYLLGSAQDALKDHRAALSLVQAIGPPIDEPMLLTSIGADLEALGRLADAARYYDAAVARLEALRESLGSLSEAKAHFLASRLAPYHRCAALLLRMGRAVDAFGVLQKAKGRVLLDLLETGGVDASVAMSDDERAEVDRLSRAVDDLNRQMVAQLARSDRRAGAQFAGLRRQAARAEQARQAYLDLLCARHPDARRRRAARTASVADAARGLGGDTAVLEYAVLRAGAGRRAVDRTVLLVVTARAGRPRVSAHIVPRRCSALAGGVRELATACAGRRGPWRPRAAALHRLLIAPAARELAGKRRLVICPDGPLWNLPFQALLDPEGRPLLERHELVYAYSASEARARPLGPRSGAGRWPDRTLLVMADPIRSAASRARASGSGLTRAASRVLVPRGARLEGLPGAEREAWAISRAVPHARVYVGAAAQEEVLKRDAGRYRYLHFATHGIVNDDVPFLSSLVVARPGPGSHEDGFLTAREIMGLNLSADLVVLSACDTGRGLVRPGEGLVGLTWAFRVAGARSQILSQWAIEDSSSAALMSGFYARLRRGEGKASALRSAALALRADRKHAHPYYWAPFFLLGDGR